MINEKYTVIDNIRVHYYENNVNIKNTLILHGFSFNAKTWVDLGTLDELERNGFGAISLDFPGFGKSEKLPGLNYDGYPVKSDEDMEKVLNFLQKFLSLSMKEKYILIGSSMGAHFSLNLMAKFPEKIEKVVLVGPVRFMNILDLLEKTSVPVLIFRGSKDTISKKEDVEILLSHLKKGKYIECENSGHACYLEKPEFFHKNLMEFLKNR